MKVLFTTLNARHVDTLDEMQKISHTLTHPDNAFVRAEGLRGAEYKITHTTQPNDESTVYLVNNQGQDSVVTVFSTDRAAGLVTIDNDTLRFKAPVAMGCVEGYSEIYVAYQGKDGAWDVFSMSKNTLLATLAPGTELPKGKAQHKRPAPERNTRAHERVSGTLFPMNAY